MKSLRWICIAATLLAPTVNAESIDSILSHYADSARTEAPSLSGFDANRGKDLYFKEFNAGKKDTPSCTSCHTNNPTQAGETRAGKSIDPMAISVNAKRYQSLKKTEKWFRRNCKSVLGRECTAAEKGDFLMFMKNS
jgi:hypothetical protein